MTKYNNRYAELRDSLKTGDIVLFSGTGPISRIIQLGTFCKWSHVGMILKIPGEYDFICLWESTTLSDTRDVDGEVIKGVALSQLSQSVADYDGEIGIRRLDANLDETDHLILMDLRKKLKGALYEKDYLELLGSVWDGPFGLNTADLSTIFCTELTAEAYQALELLDKDKPANEYTPSDWAHMEQLREGRYYKLGKIEMLKEKR